MTTDEIARLRALLAKAAPGTRRITTAPRALVVEFPCQPTSADGELLACAVNALPGLLDEVERIPQVKEDLLASRASLDFCLGLTKIAQEKRDRLLDELAEARAEVERMRAALEMVLASSYDGTHMDVGHRRCVVTGTPATTDKCPRCVGEAALAAKESK